MGTRYQIQIVHPDPQRLLPVLQRDIDALLDRFEAVFSTYRPDSEVSRFNRHTGLDWVAVPAELAVLAQRAQEISRLTDGAFDITVGPVVDLWGFGPTPQPPAVPEPALLAAALARTGYGHLAVRRQPPALRKQVPGLRLDFSAIAKGDGVDRVAALLERHGIRRYLVEIGGEIRSAGRNAADRPWRLGVELPDADGRIARSHIGLERGAVATSGDYRNYFTVDGQRFAHVVDPRSGRPARHALASVTVVAEDCASADAWATALLVLGPQRGPELAEEQGLAALFLVREGEAFSEVATDSFQPYRNP